MIFAFAYMYYESVKVAMSFFTHELIDLQINGFTYSIMVLYGM